MTLDRLLAAFAELQNTRLLREAIDARGSRAAGGLWGSSAALLVAVLHRHSTRGSARPVLALTGSDDEAAELLADLATFGVAHRILLPTLLRDPEGGPEPFSLSRRLAALHDVAQRVRSDDGDAFVLACAVGSLLQPVPDPRRLRRTGGEVSLARGGRQAIDDLLQAAAAAGMRRVPVVMAPGEIARRGDVVDLFPLAAERALRIEWLDDEIESLRWLDPATQTSLGAIDDCAVRLAGGDDGADDGAEVIDHLVHQDLLVVRVEPLRIAEELRLLLAMDAPEREVWERFEAATARLPQVRGIGALPSQDVDYKVLSAGSVVGAGEADPHGRIRALRGARGRLTVVCPTESERDRLREIFTHKQVDCAAEGVDMVVGSLRRGFRVRELEWTVLSHAEFAGVPPRARRPTRAEHPGGRVLRSFFELGPGDLVVHAAHGIARFEGIERVQRGEGEEDHLRLMFAGDVLLLVPASKIHLVQKYVGAGDAAPKLDRLGGKGFQRRKDEVHRALFDLAGELLEVQARRAQVQRPPYPRDALEDELLDGFPWVDTPDQASAWREIRTELESGQPMDRLLCGDVGFGKTELALRAAFKVAITGRQAAVLVPTTVLADQHGETFSRRCAPLGLRVEVLSRFRKGRAKSSLLADLAAGHVDIVVGTHRLLGGDVQFRDLGLLVIDEEQRFGVRQKEQLKRLRVEVDVLTLSATPIPRTLHASLLGVRSVSTLGTPPPGRQDVETEVTWRTPQLVQRVVMRELARGGQVFFLHNRIQALDGLRAEVARLVPQARVAVGHGQMTETEMERAIRGFVRGDFDVLVCTSIVENGLDIPRANTILIDDAHLFGLAELHQLRGRVGRSSEQAHCYLLMDPLQPPPDAARQRLRAVAELSHLGAGFAIAMRDLEARGAGNLLGPEQSGHIAAIGYEMYARLLQSAVAAAKDTPPQPADAPTAPLALPPDEEECDVDLRIKAFVPDDLVAGARQRLELLRELDEAVDEAAADAVRRRLQDHFGRLPPPLDNLLRVFLLKHLLTPLRLRSVQLVDGERLVVRHERGEPLPAGAWLDAFADVRPVEAGKTHLVLPRRRGGGRWSGEQVLEWLTATLLGRLPATKMRP